MFTQWLAHAEYSLALPDVTAVRLLLASIRIELGMRRTRESSPGLRTAVGRQLEAQGRGAWGQVPRCPGGVGGTSASARLIHPEAQQKSTQRRRTATPVTKICHEKPSQKRILKRDCTYMCSQITLLYNGN